MTSSRRIASAVYMILIVIVVFAAIAPLLWMLLTSVKRPVDILARPPVILPAPPTFDSWNWLWAGIGGSQKAAGLQSEPILHLALNSIIVASASTAATLALALLMAYALARFEFRGRALMAVGIIGTRMLPPIASVLPLYVLFQWLRLLDTRVGLVLAYTALNLPFAVWMLMGFVEELPIELEEAAMVDGASRTKILLNVVVPLIAPGMAATAVFSFLLAWNDFQLAFFLTSHKARTLTLASLLFLTEEGVNYGPMSAFGTTAILPVLLFALLVQKHIVRGLTLGAVKG